MEKIGKIDQHTMAWGQAAVLVLLFGVSVRLKLEPVLPAKMRRNAE